MSFLLKDNQCNYLNNIKTETELLDMEGDIRDLMISDLSRRRVVS